MIAAASLVLGACSASTDDEAGSTTSAVGSGETGAPDGAPVEGDTTGVTDTEIRIGGVYHAALFGDALAGAQARIDRENAAGGIEGRQLVLVDMLDDGGDPNTAADGARRLVEQEGVFAVGPISTPNFAAGDYLADAGVPFFGWGINPTWCENDHGFNLTGCIDSTRSTTLADFSHVWAQAAGADSIDGLSMAVISDDNDSGRTQLAAFQAVASEHGASVTYSEAALPPPPAVVGDYTPFATDILTSNAGDPPDTVSLLASAGNVIGIAAKLRELGYEGTIFNGVMYDPRAVAPAALMTTVLANAPFEQTDLPAMRQTIEDLDATSPPTAHSLSALTAYWAVDHLIQILKAVGPDLTRERFVEVLNDGFEFDGQGVFANRTYPEAHTEGISSCASAVDSDGTAYAVAAPYTCEESIPNPLLDS